MVLYHIQTNAICFDPLTVNNNRLTADKINGKSQSWRSMWWLIWGKSTVKCSKSGGMGRGIGGAWVGGSEGGLGRGIGGWALK